MKGRHIHMAYEKSVTKRKGDSLSVARREQMKHWVGDALLRKAKKLAEEPEELTYAAAAEHLEFAHLRIKNPAGSTAVTLAIDYLGGYENFASMISYPRDVHDRTRGDDRSKIRDLVFVFLDDADIGEISKKAEAVYASKQESAAKQTNVVAYLHPWDQGRSWDYKSEKRVLLPEAVAEQLQDALSDFTAYVMLATTEETLSKIAKQVGAHTFKV